MKIIHDVLDVDQIMMNVILGFIIVLVIAVT